MAASLWIYPPHKNMVLRRAAERREPRKLRYVMWIILAQRKCPIGIQRKHRTAGHRCVDDVFHRHTVSNLATWMHGHAIFSS